MQHWEHQQQQQQQQQQPWPQYNYFMSVSFVTSLA
jgi:hypothetical protein